MKMILLALVLISYSQFHAYAAQTDGDVVKDPYNLCSSPIEELRSLNLIELRQYETSGEQVICFA